MLLPHDRYDDELIATILRETRTIALLGASPNPDRPSNRVMRFLLSKGYDVTPVNPGQAGTELLGRKVFATLGDIPTAIDMVDVFRAPEYLPAIVDEMLAMTPMPRFLWGQLGVRDDEAALKAEMAGVVVVMDRCPAIEYPRLIG
ncbi:CoA-binding protein [Ciceribacter sp. L1K22]|uniref:CoA-binding protein n=1 Tax=Ciceribacter sp. L1K22 TaxID=2820275 RepID=UPI001ABDB61A|nr:CoA-binding protein [Ciceribacter sp. L1K22]MBO3759803.1 CoA-binding protein [Ciceribacter sp. L1K22]